MADATEHPSTLFTTVGHALILLEKDGVDVLEFFQRITDDVQCREAVIKLAKPIEYFTVAEIVSSSNLIDFLERLFRYERHEDFSLPELLTQYGKPGALRELFGVLNARQTSLLAMLYGLDGSKPATMDRVMAYHRLSVNKTSKMNSSSMYELIREHHRTRHQQMIASNPASIDDVSIDQLNLSQRAEHCFRRAQIYTLGQLVDKTENNLLAITNFGTSTLEEVKAKLSEWKLTLKQD